VVVGVVHKHGEPLADVHPLQSPRRALEPLDTRNDCGKVKPEGQAATHPREGILDVVEPDQAGADLGAAGRCVEGEGRAVEVRGLDGGADVGPAVQAVGHLPRLAAVGEVAPTRIVGIEDRRGVLGQGLEEPSLRSPIRLEGAVVVEVFVRRHVGHRRHRERNTQDTVLVQTL